MRALVVVMLLARVAAADTIALVSDDLALHAALDDAGGHVIVTSDKPPAIGELAASSREIADRLGATATVWLIASGQGATLVTYDRAADRTIVRELPYAPPLDAAQATEAARMVRTMLGSLRVVEPAPPPPLAPPVIAPLFVEREPHFSMSVGGGVWLAAPAAVAQPSATMIGAWRPHGLGVAASATLAPAADVAMSAFTGEITDVVIAAVARNALEVGPRVYVVPALGGSLHLLHIRGDTLDSRRFDPAARVGLAAVYDLGHDLEAGLDVSADCLLRRQRYEAGTAEILVVPRVQMVTALVVGIRL